MSCPCCIFASSWREPSSSSSSNPGGLSYISPGDRGFFYRIQGVYSWHGKLKKERWGLCPSGCRVKKNTFVWRTVKHWFYKYHSRLVWHKKQQNPPVKFQPRSVFVKLSKKMSRRNMVIRQGNFRQPQHWVPTSSSPLLLRTSKGRNHIFLRSTP